MPQSSTQLVRYDKARHALAQCERIDEVKDWSDKASALAAYAKQADDPELEAIARRIRARAFRRMGEISRELDSGTGAHLPNVPVVGHLKRKVLAEAGISKSQAHRAEKVAAIPAEDFDRRVESNTPPTMKALVRGLGHVSQNSGESEWYTPPGLIESARSAMGGIDLDPASSEKAQETVRAKSFFTAENDGLTQNWSGRTWINPPYEAKLVGPFVEKLLSEPVEQAIILVNNATETKWGQALLERADAVCFPSGRIQFLDSEGRPKQSPLQGQMIVGIGIEVGSFRREFQNIGAVLCVK